MDSFNFKTRDVVFSKLSESLSQIKNIFFIWGGEVQGSLWGTEGNSEGCKFLLKILLKKALTLALG